MHRKSRPPGGGRTIFGKGRDIMIRKIIHIDEEKCNGCGACATACHEGAIGIVNGKAKLLRDDYCDGFGDCLPACPMDAIHFVEREAAAYDEAAVQANKRKKQVQAAHAAHAGGCPGHQMHRFQCEEPAAAATPAAQPSAARPVAVPDQARAGQRAVFPGREAAHCGRLHGVCLREHAQ